MYKPTIGLEFHVEVLTKSKMFSTASTDFNAPVNTNIDPITLAYPGTLPRINKEVISKAVQACNLLGLEIDKNMRFDRKCYFYSDNPKNYQITQLHYPIGSNGKLTVGGKEVGIERLHIEEDTANQKWVDGKILINYNRAGNPLVEVVTTPTIYSSQQAYDFVKKFRDTLYFSNISDAKMEEGSLRCDVNISISKTNKLGTKVEIKNLNSFNNIKEATDFEIKRQEAVLASGGVIIEETRRWDEDKKETISMRLKDTSADYIYFPDPNIPPIRISDEFIKDAISKLPLSLSEANEKLDKLIEDKKQIDVILKDKDLTNIVVSNNKIDPKKLANFLTSDVASFVNANKLSFADLNIDNLNKLFDALEKKAISSKQSKSFVKNLFEDKDLGKVIANSGVKQISDESELKKILLEIKEENAHMLAELETRPKRVEKHFIGQLMKKTRGQANPQIAMKLLKEILK